MTDDTGLGDALDDSVRRFLLDGEGDRCPECSSPEIEARTHDGELALAYCPSCEFSIQTDFASWVRYDDLPEPFRDRFDACDGHETWNQLCERCVNRRERHEQSPHV